MLTAVNDFVVKFANVNGSGSASANGLFAKAVLRMGVPIGARNIFPSNIQGLPTWYEVRVSEAGWLGRRGGGVDLMVAMNPQTFAQDLAEIVPGGYLLYDATRPMNAARLREDVSVLGVPLTAICNAAYTDARQRQLFKNIVYVGALSHLIGMDAQVVETLLAQEFASKPKLIDANIQAFHLGRSWAAENMAPIGLQLRASDQVGDRIFTDGNNACGLGAVYGGATVCAWYPITPSTSIAEAFTKWCRKFRTDADTGEQRYAIVQAEDEIASVGMVQGASWNGARAFTCTSGPGVSLMQEFIGFSYFAEIPAVIFDVQRGGPSTGMPTRTQQSDLMLAAYGSHGDTKHVMLMPADPHECFEMSAAAFDLSDRLQTTVFVMLDLDIGMNDWLVAPFRWDDARRLDRGKVLTPAELEAAPPPGRYEDVDGDAIGWRTLPGSHPQRGAYFTRGSSHDAKARYSEVGADYVEVMERLSRKFETARSLLPAPVTLGRGSSAVGVVYFGSTDPAMQEAVQLLEQDGLTVDAMRVRGFPFHPEVFDFIAAHERVFVVEQNRDAQLRSLLILDGEIDPRKLEAVLYYEGSPITAKVIVAEIAGRLRPAMMQAAE